MRQKFLPPSAEHLFGTDNLGRSLWSRVVWGAQLSMFIGSAVVAINAVFGTLIGAAAGYFRALDNVLMRINDALMAFPAVLLAIGVTAVLGPSVNDVIIALGVVYTPRTARIVRSSVIVLREMEYVQAAVAAGAGHWRILRRHILPNAMAPLIVQLSFLFAYAVLTEATLSFLGVGAVPPTPTWGNIMAEGRQYMIDAPWIITIPGRGADDHRAGAEPAGRWAARCAGSAAEDPAVTLPAPLLPLPLREGVGGRGRCQSGAPQLAAPPPPNPLPQGEGEDCFSNCFSSSCSNCFSNCSSSPPWPCAVCPCSP